MPQPKEEEQQKQGVRRGTLTSSTRGDVMEKKYFILKLDSYEGEGSSLTVAADWADSMYVVLNVEGSSAEIVDWGYPTVDDLLSAWDNVTFENVGEFK